MTQRGYAPISLLSIREPLIHCAVCKLCREFGGCRVLSWHPYLGEHSSEGATFESSLLLQVAQFTLLDLGRIISSTCHWCPIWGGCVGKEMSVCIPPEKAKYTSEDIKRPSLRTETNIQNKALQEVIVTCPWPKNYETYIWFITYEERNPCNNNLSEPQVWDPTLTMTCIAKINSEYSSNSNNDGIRSKSETMICLTSKKKNTPRWQDGCLSK